MRSIPDDHLGLPVLIKFNNGSSGSGLNIKINNELFFVTAKHVLVNQSNNLNGLTGTLTAYSSDYKDELPTILKLDFEKLMKGGNIKLHSTKDVAVIKIGNLIGEEFGLLPEINLISKSEKGLVWATETNLLAYDNVLVSNDVIIFGYPSSIGMQNSPQFDYERPLIRKGIIASKYKKANTIILDCPVYYGNSGGPVIQIEEEKGVLQFRIIGIVSQFVPYVENWVNSKNNVTNTTILNSGYSVAVSIDSVLELIR
jgi:V8-like Glu-specific endopeptidase